MGDTNAFGEGSIIQMESRLGKQDFVVLFDLTGVKLEQVARAACKDWLSDLCNSARARVRSAAQKGEALTESEALGMYAERREDGKYLVRVLDKYNDVKKPKVKVLVTKDAILRALKAMSERDRLSLLQSLQKESDPNSFDEEEVEEEEEDEEEDEEEE